MAFVGRGHTREIRSFSGPTARPRLLCFVAPKGDRIISAGDDATIRVWDTETKREVNAVKVSTSPHRLKPTLNAAIDDIETYVDKLFSQGAQIRLRQSLKERKAG